MAQGGSRNQKQAAKAAKRKAVVAAKIRSERLATSLPGQIAAAATAPIHRCLRTTDMLDVGIGHLILARRLPSGTFGCAFVLVDLFCLGAKDAFYREMAPSEFEEHLETLKEESQPVVDIDPAAAKRLVTGAVAFAAASGFEPAKDYRTVVKLFGDVDAESSSEHFTFGRDGKAIYIPGPNDSATRMREIERVLERHRGPEGWDFEPGPEADAMMKRLSALLDGDLRSDDGAFVDDGDGPIIEHEGSPEPAADGSDKPA